MPPVLTHKQLAERVAIAGCVKTKDVNAAKAGLPDGTSYDVDVTVRIQGTVTKGVGTPEVVTTKPATVSLLTLGVIADTLRRAGVDAKTLKRCLRAAAAHREEPLAEHDLNAELVAVIRGVEAKASEQAGEVEVRVPAKRGAASAAATTYAILPSESAPCATTRLAA